MAKDVIWHKIIMIANGKPKVVTLKALQLMEQDKNILGTYQDLGECDEGGELIGEIGENNFSTKPKIEKPQTKPVLKPILKPVNKETTKVKIPPDEKDEMPGDVKLERTKEGQFYTKDKQPTAEQLAKKLQRDKEYADSLKQKDNDSKEEAGKTGSKKGTAKAGNNKGSNK